MSELVSPITDADFEAQVLQATIPTLVDFWAQWCGPCKAIAPILDEIAEQYASKLKIVKINVDENSETPTKYGVRGIPTLILFNEGEIVATKVGSMTKSQLSAFIDSNI